MATKDEDIEADRARREQCNLDEGLLAEHFALLLSRYDKIRETPEMFFCRPAGAGVMTGGDLPLGALLELWRAGKFARKCSDCSDTVFLYALWGSPLSGCHNWYGVCPTCRSAKKGSGGTCITLWPEASQLARRYKNLPILKKGERAQFSWGRGLVGKDEPDVLVVDKVHGLSLQEVIQGLQKHAE